MKPSTHVDHFLEAWHETIAKKDLSLIDPWVTDDVKLYSPALYRPKEGKKTVTALLQDVLCCFEGYTVTKTWIDGHEILLEFDVKVKGYAIQGIDKITLNSQGQMSQLRVYIRPFSGLKALIKSVVQLQISRMHGIQKVIARIAFVMKSRSS